MRRRRRGRRRRSGSGRGASSVEILAATSLQNNSEASVNANAPPAGSRVYADNLRINTTFKATRSTAGVRATRSGD